MTTDSQQADRPLTTKQAAEALNVTPHTLENWRHAGRGPRFIRYSRTCIRYRPADLDAWLAQRAAESATDSQLSAAAQ
ncbi:helix-turn-helix domain-containing protein [Pseudoxanthomonas helianthi]|uniref:Helix-turn-helix domain-containing protein n=1 Tax=Pseudoxanthomonas helianthi TaxID=1453541 RepID=A0A940X420_9GAMM|nr:helix-turn-helix domain-containing protein [Pseudoxanthomonas helianthi]MBP3984787.1 helix-turn-helix domain-containing protein [Pseudoxanthomonas helianthi]